MFLDIARRIAPAILRRDINLAVPRLPSLSSHIRSISAASPVYKPVEQSGAAPRTSPLNPTFTDFRDGPRKWDSLLMEASKNSIKELEPQELWDKWEKDRVARLEPPHNAYSGRSISVSKLGVMHALAKLNSVCRANKVRQEYFAQQRHEKKGDHRRRLRSERWRKRFAHEVRKKIKLANEIRARGS